MDPCSDEADFESTREEDLDVGGLPTVSDDDYDEACQVRADLQEIGMHGLSAWAAWRVRRTARLQLVAYRDARSASDLRRPGADQALRAARSALHSAALVALEDFPGWNDSGGGQP